MDGSQAGEGKLAFTLRVPIGVVGAISPFNFPLNLVAHKIAPALAAGCPVVLKPATQTPLSALLLAELEEEAGLPPGWLSVVVGPASEIGDVLVEDERVRLITFTGSGDVGWGIRERAPRKKVNLELGNATPAIVCCDAPPSTAEKLAANSFSFAGQSCISVQRIYVMARCVGRLRPRLRAEGRGAEGRRPGRRRHRRRPADRGEGTRSRARVGPRELRRGADRRRADGRRTAAADRDREPRADRQGAVGGGLRARRDAHADELARGGDRAARTRRATGSRLRSSASTSAPRSSPRSNSSSVG